MGKTTSLGAAIAALALFAGAASAQAAQGPVTRPNIVLIQTDDQNAVELNDRTMPATERLLAGSGTTFRNYVVATPVCCPSRAALLTGQYPHNNGLTANDPGYPALADPGNILPAWLKQAGYVTIHVGKYLNNYVDSSGSIGTPAPGWDVWTAVGDITRYYNYDLGINGTVVHHGSLPGDYVTRVLNGEAIDAVHTWAASGVPFYLQLDERAPHESPGVEASGRCPLGPIPDDRDTYRFLHAALPVSPSFNEPDVSDKPEVVRRIPPLTGPAIKSIEKSYGCRLASLRAVDRGVAGIYNALLQARALRNTVFVFISDNGFFSGEHRLSKGKTVPYWEAIHEPLVIRLPPSLKGAGTPSEVGPIAANIDIAPTLLALAGASPCASPDDCRTLDGRSLLPLLLGEHPAWAPHRSILIEFRQNPSRPASSHGVCAYQSVYDRSANYTRYTSATTISSSSCQPTDQRELYDRHADPFQLQNLYPADGGSAGSLQARMQSRLDRLRDCAGIAGRDPRPASGHYCR